MPKCKNCQIMIDKKDVVIYIDEKEKKLNFCSNKCSEEYKQFLVESKITTLEYQNLIEYIMKIHNQTFLPSSFYLSLKDLRDGTVRQKGIYIKKINKGVNNQDLLDAYKYSEDIIKWAILNKTFISISNELNYCLAVVKNNLSKSKQAKKQKTMNDNIKQEIKIEEDYNYVKKEIENDISDILD